MPYLKQVIGRLNEAKEVLLDEQKRIQIAIDYIDRCIKMHDWDSMATSVLQSKQSLEQEIEKYVAGEGEANCLNCGKAYKPTIKQGGNPQRFCSIACGRTENGRTPWRRLSKNVAG